MTDRIGHDRFIEGVLIRLKNSLGATSCTFYVEDPWWPGELRLALMPGVKYKEPMQGFLLPFRSKLNIIKGKPLRLFKNSQKEWKFDGDGDAAVLRRLNQKNKLYGSFVEREGIQSSIRLLWRKKDGRVTNVLFVNFDKNIASLPSAWKKMLQDQMRELAERFSPLIIAGLKTGDPIPIKQVLRILQSNEEHWDVSYDANLKRILNSAMEAAQISEKTGVGAIYVYEYDKRSLTLVEARGITDVSAFSKFREVKIDGGQGIISWVALHRSEILINDLEKSEFKKIFIPTRRNVRSVLAVPILAPGDRLVGVVNLESIYENAFSPQLLRAIWCIANQGAAMYRPAAMLQNLLSISSETPNPSGLRWPLNGLAQIVREYQRANICDIWQLDLTKKSFTAIGTTHKKESRAFPRMPGAGWSHYVLKAKVPVLISNIQDKNTFTVETWDVAKNQWQTNQRKNTPESINDIILKLKVKEELGVPIVTLKNCVGVIWLKYLNEGEAPRTRTEMASLFGFAGQMAMVMLSLQKHEELHLKSINEGMKMLIRSLQHDVVGKIAGRIYVEINDVIKNGASNPNIQISTDKIKGWHWLLNLQKSTVSHLRRVAEGLAGKFAPDKKKFKLADIVNKAIIVGEILQVNPPCENEVDPNLEINADETLILLVLINLIQNAKKFMSDERMKEPVVVTAFEVAESARSGVVVTVDDCGNGFLKRLIDSVYTQHGPQMKGNPNAPGSGTGLYLCSQFVLAHNGEMFKPETNERGGARVRFFIPRA